MRSITRAAIAVGLALAALTGLATLVATPAGASDTIPELTEDAPLRVLPRRCIQCYPTTTCTTVPGPTTTVPAPTTTAAAPTTTSPPVTVIVPVEIPVPVEAPAAVDVDVAPEIFVVGDTTDTPVTRAGAVIAVPLFTG